MPNFNKLKNATITYDEETDSPSRGFLDKIGGAFTKFGNLFRGESPAVRIIEPLKTDRGYNSRVL